MHQRCMKSIRWTSTLHRVQHMLQNLRKKHDKADYYICHVKMLRDKALAAAPYIALILFYTYLDEGLPKSLGLL